MQAGDIRASLELQWVDPKTLQAHPANWRLHPEEQVAALQGALREHGWAGAILVNRRTGRILDGHARHELAVTLELPAVPVLVGEWDEAQELGILASHDPIGAMAKADDGRLRYVLEHANVQNEALAELLSSLLDEMNPPEAGGGGGDRGERGDPQDAIEEIKLYFTKREYPAFQRRMDSVMAAAGVDNYTSAVVYLLDTWEDAEHDRDRH